MLAVLKNPDNFQGAADVGGDCYSATTTTQHRDALGCGSCSFRQAYELYCAHFPPALPCPTECSFRDALLDFEHGLCVYIMDLPATVGERLVCLRPDSFNLESLVRLLGTSAKPPRATSARLSLDSTSVHLILQSMDSEYDRSCARALLAADRSLAQLADLGVKPAVAARDVNRVLSIVKEVELASVTCSS